MTDETWPPADWFVRGATTAQIRAALDEAGITREAYERRFKELSFQNPVYGVQPPSVVVFLRLPDGRWRATMQ